jgi:hypothetical protein
MRLGQFGVRRDAPRTRPRLRFAAISEGMSELAPGSGRLVRALVALVALVALASSSGCAHVVAPRRPGARLDGPSEPAPDRRAEGGRSAHPSSPPLGPVAPAEPGAPLPPATYLEPLPKRLDPSAPAARYGKLDARACRAEAERRGLPVALDREARPGVDAPVRITGPMNGVAIAVPPTSSKHGVLDCRVALLLDEWTRALAAEGIAKLVVDNAYRPGAKLPGNKRKPSQHALGLALDVTRFETREGARLSVDDWGAAIGETPCGPGAVLRDPSATRVAVRNLVCATARAGYFQTLLTPSHDAAHRSHFHFDLQEDRDQLVVR